MEKTYEPKAFEEKLYKEWQENGYFKSVPNSKKQPFTIVMPPPNITGQLHVGHALDNSLQDSIIRYKRMKGFETLWIPGTDHASIATEVKIVEQLQKQGKSKKDVGRDEFLKLSFEWKEKYGGRIIEQLKKLGSSCDWDRTAFTMDFKRSEAVKEVFVNMYEKGLIYRGDRIINWCVDCLTAISDAEVEHEESDSKLWYIDYPLEDSSGYITVATTRPETMLGDTAVAVNPLDKRYSHFIGKNIILPLSNRLIPVIADEYVDKEFGTGAVKITPAHDPNDFEVGLRHNLEVLKILDGDGSINENAPEKFRGLSRENARIQVLKELEAQGFLKKIEPHKNNVGRCYRCGTVIEPMVSKQWFVKMSPLAVPSIGGVKNGDIKFMPKRFEKIYLHWMENIRDWCISRQLWWGHRIPAYYCDCGKMTVSKTEIKSCPDCGKSVRRDEDVLDTWFSSALWPFSTLGYPEKTKDLEYYYPTNVLVTAYDIIFFWVARMIFSGYEHMGQKPFSEVLIHGIVRDEEGRKMSKSLGNGVDPLEIIEKYGADALRIALLLGVAAGNDIRFSEDKLIGYRNFMNKIWNASRFVLMNCENADILPIEKVKNLTLADKWIITRLNKVIASTDKYMNKYEMGLAASALYDFIWTEFCDWYIELSKTALYSENKEKRSSTVSVLLYALKTLLKLIHPIIPFVTEEIYKSLPANTEESIMISSFPKPIKNYKKDAEDLEKVMILIKGIRNMRLEMNVSQAKRTAIYIVPANGYEKLIEQAAPYIEKLAMGNKMQFYKPTEKSAAYASEIAEVFIPMGELIDVSVERERLTKELKTLTAEIQRAEGKLNNQGFVSKAPPALIEEEKAKLLKFITLKEKLEQGLKNLD